MEQIEADQRSVRAEIAALGTAVAVQTALHQQINDALKSAQDERSRMWAEVRAMGAQTVSLTNEIRNLSREVAELKPMVGSYHDDRLMIAGGAKLAVGLKQVMWMIGGMVASFLAALATFFGLIKNPPPH